MSIQSYEEACDFCIGIIINRNSTSCTSTYESYEYEYMTFFFFLSSLYLSFAILTVQLVPEDFTKRIIPLSRTHSQAVE